MNLFAEKTSFFGLPSPLPHPRSSSSSQKLSTIFFSETNSHARTAMNTDRNANQLMEGWDDAKRYIFIDHNFCSSHIRTHTSNIFFALRFMSRFRYYFSESAGARNVNQLKHGSQWTRTIIEICRPTNKKWPFHSKINEVLFFKRCKHPNQACSQWRTSVNSAPRRPTTIWPSHPYPRWP